MYSSYTPRKTYPPVSTIKNDTLDTKDMTTYLNCILANPRQMITKSQEIHAFNSFADAGIHFTIKKLFNIDSFLPNNRTNTDIDKKIKTFRLQIIFTHVELDTPKYVDKSGLKVPRNPDDCRVSKDFYAADLILNVTYRITAIKHDGTEDVKEKIVEGLTISSVPIMVKSNHCNTYQNSTEMLQEINEDPTDPGGYFIDKGNEYVLVGTENIVFNKPLVFVPTTKGERVYSTLISQQESNMFSNSTNLVIRMLNDYAIVLEIQTYTFSKLKIPFYILYRIYGILSDEEILNMIVYDRDRKTNETQKMEEIVIKAFQVKYPTERKSGQLSMVENIEHIYDLVSDLEDSTLYKKDPETARHVINTMREKLDKSFIPHVGTKPEDRPSKLLHLSMMIRDVIMVDLGMKQSDDRDHYSNKRCHGAGISIAKAFKTLFNIKVVMPMLSVLRTEVINKSFDTINMNDTIVTIKNIVSGRDLESAFSKYIMASENENTRAREKIRITAQPLERKNMINVILTLRTITANVAKVAKSTKRSDNIRYWHPSAAGIICPFNTPEGGDKVGIVKQMAITTIITDVQITDEVKKFVKEDPNIILSTNIHPVELSREYYARIYVDGDWVACTKDPASFVLRYRLLRREGVLHRHTSIEWNAITNVIYIYADIGRLMRPLLIVDNNLEEFNKEQEKGNKDFKFIQNIRLSKDDILGIRRGHLKFQDLVDRGYIEYIYPGEEVLLCPSLEYLRSDKHNYLKRWTHCDVPETLFGLAVLTGPYLDRNQPFRNIMVQIHAKQSCGRPFTNIQTATRKSHRFSQYVINTPLVKTITRDIVPPNSQTGMLLYAVFLGHNQEDSSILNKGSVDRGFLKGSYYKMDTQEIEKNQSIRIPKEKETHYMRTASYAKLQDNGIAGIGSILEKGDIMIGRVVELAQPTESGHKYIDKSIPYEYDEPGRLISIISKLDGEQKFIILTFEFERPLNIGDKMSLLKDHDVLTDKGWVPIDEVTLEHKVCTLHNGKEIKYDHPVRLIKYDYDGDMYEIENSQISLHVTGNHEMWVQRRDDTSFQHVKARDLLNVKCRYKKDGYNSNPDIPLYLNKYDMDTWLEYLGHWLMDGYICDTVVITTAHEQHKIANILTRLGVDWYYCHTDDSKINYHLENKDIWDEITNLDYIWDLSQRQSRILLETLLSADDTYYAPSIRLRDITMRLCLHCGYSGMYVQIDTNIWRIHVNRANNQPEVIHDYTQKERLYKLDKPTTVYCLEVPSHVMYVRRGGKPCWTCNSSRAGNKTIISQLIPEMDMPYTKEGLRPDVILNPHSIPTRMTLAQLFESTMSKLAAKKGIIVDGTVYRRFDIFELLEELEKEGLVIRDKMVNGMTGELIETALFYGPQTVLRIPKFVKEDRHAIGKSGPKNPITGQALTGKRMGGGHKVGEMELWVILAQGAANTLNEEFFLDSDVFPIYVCRTCQKMAIYNDKRKRYKCSNLDCPLTDIAKIDSSKTALLFLQELQMANIGISIHPEPRMFEDI